MKWQFWKPEIVKYRDGTYAIRKYEVSTEELFGQWMYFNPEPNGMLGRWTDTTSPMTRTTSIERVTAAFDVLTDKGRPLTEDEVIAEKVTAKLNPQPEPQHDYDSKLNAAKSATSSAMAYEETKHRYLAEQNRAYLDQYITENKRLSGKY